MDRFLRIRIWREDGQGIEYDNKIDDFWGIDSGTADLNQIVMRSELSYGEFNSAIFQVRVYGLDKDIKLNGRTILVTLEYVYETELKVLVDEDDVPITTENNTYIITQPSEEISDNKNIFYGTINSSESDIIKTDRNIIAYDMAYTYKEINIASWWNTFWKTQFGNDITLATFRTQLLSDNNITAESTTLINDSVVIPNPFKSATDDDITYTLTFGDVIQMICKLQNCTPVINGNNRMEFIRLGKNSYDIEGETEGLNSTWKDYETEKITGVAFYGESTIDPIRVVGTTDNVYNIAGNLLALNMTTATLDAVGTAILNDIKDIQYVPSYVHMKVSRPEIELGSKLYTDGGVSYVMQQTLSGSLLVDQEFDSVAIEATLNKDVVDYNDTIMKADKSASIEKEITDTKAEIVLKADANGRIVTVALGADASTGSSFSVKADDIAFISNGMMQLQANNLSISAGLTSMSDTSHNGVFLSPDGFYVKGSSGNYFKADKNGNINASGIELDTLYFTNPSSGALVQLSMTGANSYAQLSNLTITNGLTINSGKSLNYRGTELQTLLDAKKNSSSIHAGTFTCTFTNGEAHVAFSTVGVSSRPNGLVICPQYLGYIVVTYMFDLSTSQIVLYGWACDTGGGYGEWYNGSFRCSYVCIT